MDFWDDDSAQASLMGTGRLILEIVVATVVLGLLWIIFGVQIDMMMEYSIDMWIAAGWVTEQSRGIVEGLLTYFSAIVAIAFLTILINALVKGYVLKEARY
jgi:hypothetical protein